VDKELFIITIIVPDAERPVEIALNSICENCNGRGKAVAWETETVGICEPCGGTGTRLTYNGQDLLRFIEKHRTHPDRNLEDLP
jgi:hypothetical protein